MQRDQHMLKLLVCASVVITLLSGCSISRNLEEHEMLLRRNNINVHHPDHEQKNFSPSELERFYQQKPNKRMLRIIPFHAAAYNYGQRINIPDSAGFSGLRKFFWKRKHNYRSWILKNAEAPVVLDTAMAARTIEQFESFLFTRGHFDARAEKVINPIRRKKGAVTYNIFPGPGHSIRTVNTEIPTASVRLLYENHADEALIRIGMPYNEREFQKERERVTRLLKEQGYYHFDKAYIVLEVDTFVPGNQLDIWFRVLDQSFVEDIQSGSLRFQKHLPARIRNIYVNPEFQGDFVQQQLELTPVKAKRGNEESEDTYFFYTSDQHSFKPQVLIRNIFLEPGQRYDIRQVERTYLQLADLSSFSTVSISFSDVDSLINPNDTVIWIDCHINLMRMQKQSYEINLDATNRAGDPGITSYFVYQNRNLFKGAEVLSLSLRGAVESHKIALEDDDENHLMLWFGTVELGSDLDIRVPRFVAPFNLAGLSKTYNPKTRFTAGVNYQQRTDFKRYVIKLNTGYEWQFRQNMFMTFNPLEISAVSIFPEPGFQKKIDDFNDPRLRNAYSDHIITSTRMILLRDNQGQRSRSNYAYVRITLESAGFLVNALSKPLNYPANEEGFSMLFNIPYAQYLRSDIDYRHYFKLRQKDALIAARIYLGLGNPYGNMNVLPYEKSFYVGGTNGIRAWPMRTIGPGSYGDQQSTLRFDRSGDMALESSAEYRFPMYGNIHGAVFVDAGNVWLKNKSTRYPGGELKADQFFKELAIGTGFGVRIVTFFVIRVDAGIKVHDPSRPDQERWVIDEFGLRKINWNFGIGYSI